MTLSTLGEGGGVVKAGRKYSDPPFVEGELALRLEGRFKGATKFEDRELAGLNKMHRKYFQGQVLFRYTFTPRCSSKGPNAV
jgi:hypothetical protein